MILLSLVGDVFGSPEHKKRAMTDESPNRQDERPKSTRRSILRTSGIALATAVGIGGASAGSALADDGVDTDFNPDKPKEVGGFLNDVSDLSEQKQKEYAKDLSKAQKEAIVDLYMNADLEVTTYSNSGGLQTSDSYTTATETLEAKGQVPVQGTVYVHKQILNWDYSGDDYKNASQQLQYKLPGPYATFQGKTEDNINEGASSFTATLSAKYAFELFGAKRGGEATLVTEGKENGEYEVLERDKPTS
ncbi:hypothetical protein [Halobacterium hubeiense]|nr:hypothetical protein [Halobacterium hubeiense]